jgi:hypothetical protein
MVEEEMKARRIKLTKESIKHYEDWVYAKGKERELKFGKNDAAAFAMGACVFYFAFGIQDQIPVSLIMGPLLGQNIFIFDEEEKPVVGVGGSNAVKCGEQKKRR